MTSYGLLSSKSFICHLCHQRILTKKKLSVKIMNSLLYIWSFLFLMGCNRAKSQVIWPYGTYGLPKVQTGCPESEGLPWSEGWRNQDLEDAKAKTELSTNLHMDAKLFANESNLNRTFCMKTKLGSSKRMWPKGLYCVYRAKNSSCPAGMTEGSVKWDDEDFRNKNEHGGILPDGVYDTNTILNYCCQNQGRWNNSVDLPVHRPFYLLPHNTSDTVKCQLVKWALASLEFIIYDTNDMPNADAFSGDHVFIETLGSSLLKTYYCYYEGCRYQVTADKGILRSPSEDLSGFRRFHYCSWLVTVNRSFVVLINFTRLAISNCEENALKVYDGANDQAPIIAKFCGSNATSVARNITSSSNNLLLVLKSGSSSNNTRIHQGFEAEYSAHEISTDHDKQDEPTQTGPVSESSDNDSVAIPLIIVATILLLTVSIVVGLRYKLGWCRRKNSQQREHSSQARPQVTEVDENRHYKDSERDRTFGMASRPLPQISQNSQTYDADEHPYSDLSNSTREPEHNYESLAHPNKSEDEVQYAQDDYIYENQYMDLDSSNQQPENEYESLDLSV